MKKRLWRRGFIIVVYYEKGKKHDFYKRKNPEDQ